MKALFQRDSIASGESATLPLANGIHPVKAPVVAAVSDSDPADSWVSCTPNDDTEYSPLPTAIFVGTTGHLALRGADGVNVTFKNLPSGSFVPLQPSRVLATGTTALDIVLIYRSTP